jgi:hypothetical protein
LNLDGFWQEVKLENLGKGQDHSINDRKLKVGVRFEGESSDLCQKEYHKKVAQCMSNIGISGGLRVEKSKVGKNLMPKETVI